MPDWPSCFPKTANLGDLPLAADCTTCGHSVAVHSRERGCVLCELVSKYGLSTKKWGAR